MKEASQQQWWVLLLDPQNVLVELMSKELVRPKMQLDRRASGSVFVREGVEDTSHSQKLCQRMSRYGLGRLAVLTKMRGWRVQEKGVDRIERDYRAKVDQLAISQVEGMTLRAGGV
jgi:hypothetical protein